MIAEEEIPKQRDYSTDEIQKQGENIWGGGGRVGGVKFARQMVSFLDDMNTLDAISRVV
jgi:hypothetical protein